MSINAPVQNSVRSELSASLVPWERVEKFVGQISHDLRNGLNACELQLTFLAEISTDPDAKEEVKGLRESLAGITKQLQAIRVAAGTVKAHTLDYPAADLFEDLRERFLRLHPEASSRVEWRDDVEGGTLVKIDPDITLNAVLELLNNALHFADAGTPVLCTWGQEGSQVSCVARQSLGTRPSDPPEEWGQSPLQSTRRGAYGLGLFRTRRILAAQGSRLEIRYLDDQKALTATVTLPAAA